MEKIATLLRTNWHHAVIITGIMAAAIFVAGLWLSVQHPAAGEIWQNQIINSMLLLISLGSAFFAGVIVRGFYRSCVEIKPDMPVGTGPIERALLWVGIRLDRPEPTPALPAWSAPDVSPDEIVCLLPGETAAEYAARAKAMRETATAFRWVAVIPFREVAAVIYTGEHAENVFAFSRNLPPFADIVPDGKGVPPMWDFAAETEDEYRHYAGWFAYYFRRWASGEKLRIDAGRAGKTILETLAAKGAASVNIILFVLLSVSAFGQKLEQVKATGISGKTPDEGVPVSFIFEKTDIYRTGNGQSTYAELLTSAPNYRDGGGGKLQAIIANNKSQWKAAAAEQVAQTKEVDPMRPHRAETPVMNKPAFAVPDSAEITAQVDDAKRWIDEGRSAFWSRIKPIWELVMYGFWSLFFLLLCLLGLFRYVAKTAANESLINTYGRVIFGRWVVQVQENAAAGTLLICWIIAIVLLINIFLTFIWWDWPEWAIVAAWFPVLWIAQVVTNKLVPNVRVADDVSGFPADFKRRIPG